jgi:HEAT repeat protein
MSTSGDIGVLTTDLSLLVQSWDDWLVRATSISTGDARGRPLSELIPALSEGGFLDKFRQTIDSGIVQVFSSTLHGPVIPCPPRSGSRHYDVMQQRVTVGPLLDGERVAGLVITLQDITAQLDAERDLAAALVSDDVEERRAASEAIAAASQIESPDHFFPALRHADWRIRRAAVTALAAAADQDLLRAVLRTLEREHRDFSTLSSALRLLAATSEDLTAPLTELLRDADVDLRIQAALALGEQHFAAAVTPLLAALDDPDANVRFHAIEALGRLRSTAAVDRLLSIAESREFFLGFAALEALSEIGDASVAPRLLPLLQNDDFRESAGRALSTLGDERIVMPLVEAINESPDVTVAAIQALASIADRLTHEDLDVSSLVQSSLTDTGRRNLLAVVQTARRDTGSALTRVLRWIGGVEASQALGAMLTDPDLRSEAADALAEIGEPAVDVLLERLRNGDDDVRALAIGTLGRIGSRRATPGLIRMLEDPRLAIPASGALARVADPDAFEPLLSLLGHPDQAVRMAVVGALNAIGHPEMQTRIIPRLDDDDPLVRESAVRIAGYFGYQRAADRVLARAADHDEAVRVAALEQLPFFDDERALEILGIAIAEGTPKTRVAAARALTRVESSAVVPLLAQALQDPDPWVRYFAARALADQPGAIDVPELLTVAASDPSPPVRVAAIHAIGTRGSAVPLEPLVDAAGGENLDVAAAALGTLGRLGGVEAMTALRTAARAAEVPRRRAAVEGLAALASGEAVSELEWIAAADPDRQVSHDAIGKLGEIASSGGSVATQAVDALVALLAEADRSDGTIAALLSVPIDLVSRLANGLSHSQPVVRRRTVEALGRLRHPEATRLIVPAFDDPDATVREAVAVVVHRLGTRIFDDRLRRLSSKDPSRAVRRAADAALACVRATD